jgi:hypothetical protein
MGEGIVCVCVLELIDEGFLQKDDNGDRILCDLSQLKVTIAFVESHLRTSGCEIEFLFGG